MENLNSVFFGIWYFFENFLFFIWAFMIFIGIVFSVIYQFWKRPT